MTQGPDTAPGAAVPPPAPSGWRVYRRLLGHVRPHWRVFAVALAAMALTALTEPVLPFLMKELLDRGFGEARTLEVWMVPAALLLLFGLRGVFTFTAGYCLSWVEQRVLADLRRAMFERLVAMPAPVYDREAGGNIVSRLVYDVGNVTQMATIVLTTLVRDSLVVAGLIGWLLWLNWKLTLIVFVLVPAVAVVIWSFTRRMRLLNRENLQVMGRMTHVVDEAIACQKVVKVYGGQPRERARFFDASERLRTFARRLAVAQGLVVPITQLMAASAVSAVIVIAMLQTGTASATVGGFVSFVTAMLMLLAPLKHLADINNALQRGIAAAERVFEFLDGPREADPGTRTIARARGELSFDDVWLRYGENERWALAGVTLQVPAGATVALVGTSGGGKTSLVNLLPRFYEPVRGTVRLDDVPVRELALASLRAQVAIVSQDVMLFNDSLANNVAYGTPRDEARLARALTAAHLDELVAAMPQGVETEIGDNGVRLSGGQRQRLAIARAIYKDAPVLILDEATSALDTESERHVQAALETLMRGRTTLVIAHRLSTIERADRIVVFAHGRIVEQGTHASLLAAGGLYARLHAGGELAGAADVPA